MVLQSPPVRLLITRFEDKTNLAFKPTNRFYKSVGINAHRFSLITKGQKPPTSDEIRELLEYFGQFFPVQAEDLL